MGSPGEDLSNEIPLTLIPEERRVIPAVVDLSYLKELSHGNTAFEKEMIVLFLQKAPQDIELLEKAIQKQDYSDVKIIAHKLKSTFALFKLDESQVPLAQIETEATNPPLSTRSIEGFDSVKKKLEETMLGLKTILAKEYHS